LRREKERGLKKEREKGLKRERAKGKKKLILSSGLYKSFFKDLHG